VCLSVGLFVNTITREPLGMSSRNFKASSYVERADEFEDGYSRVRGWWENASDVLALRLESTAETERTRTRGKAKPDGRPLGGSKLRSFTVCRPKFTRLSVHVQE